MNMLPFSSAQTQDAIHISVAESQARMRAGLALPPRLVYVLLLFASTAMAVVLGALLLTEPSLPTRTQLTFMLMLGTALAWMGFAIWVLRARAVLLATHRVLAARLGVVCTLLFTACAVAFAPWGDNRAGSLAITSTGLLFFGFAMLRVVQAQRLERALQHRRAQLQAQLQHAGTSAL